MMNKRALICILALGLLIAASFLWWRSQFGYRHPRGVAVAKDEPMQTALTAPRKWNAKGYLITALAEFSMTGRVIMTDRYYTGREAGISPVDLTLAWGPLSNTSVLEKIKFSHSERYYNYESEWVSPDVIKCHTSNMHMIPANPTVARVLKSIRREDVVTLRGYLVQADATDGWSWTSSLARDDGGPGACELVWVEALRRR